MILKSFRISPIYTMHQNQSSFKDKNIQSTEKKNLYGNTKNPANASRAYKEKETVWFRQPIDWDYSTRILCTD